MRELHQLNQFFACVKEILDPETLKLLANGCNKIKRTKTTRSADEEIEGDEATYIGVEEKSANEESDSF